MSIPLDGTYSVPVSSPSPHLAMLRTVMLKAAGVARNVWSGTRATLRLAGQLPRSVAVSVSSLLATRTGYTLLTSTVGSLVRGAWNGVTAVAKGVGRASRTLAGLITLTVGYLSPAGADWTLRLTDTVAERVTAVARSVDATVRGSGDLLWSLAHTTLVRTTVITTASLASGVFVVHTLTQGLLAVRIVQAAPALMTAVVWATDPWRTLALVGFTAAAALVVALVRLIHSSRTSDGWEPEPPTTAASGPHIQPAPEPESEPAQVVDFNAIAASLTIEITNDGSVVVHGIPDDVRREDGEIIARIATDAALKHWRRTRTSRPTPSRDDRRLFTKAAKEAIRKHAHNRAA